MPNYTQLQACNTYALDVNFHWKGIRDNDLNEDCKRFAEFIDREFCALNCADNFMETFLFRDSE